MTPAQEEVLTEAVKQGRYVQITWAVPTQKFDKAAEVVEDFPQPTLAIPGKTPEGVWYITSSKWSDRGYILPSHLVAEVKLTNVWDFYHAYCKRARSNDEKKEH